jgi:hypothetical protein
VSKNAAGVLLLATIVSITTPAAGEDDFPIVGSYWRDIACQGSGKDRPDLLVRVTHERIESTMGVCTILNRKRAGKTFQLHLECKLPGGQSVLGDVTFTPRDGNTVDFEDQDHTSDATLHKCAG